MSPTLDAPLQVGGLRLRNRLYRAPLLEHAGNGPEAADRLVAELEPAAASGAGLVMQGATPVRGYEGCAAPGMTGFDDPDRVASMRRLTDAVHERGARIFCQLAHGGLRSFEVWHHEHRAAHPDLTQRAVSRPPWPLRVLDAVGVVSFDVEVLSTDAVYALAAEFGERAAWAEAAGYDGIHLTGANTSLFHQFLSPLYNRRDDEFGGDLAGRARFFEVVHDEISANTDLPVVTKVPVETEAPRFLPHVDWDEGVAACERLAAAGYDALVPVRTTPFWDASIIKGAVPERAWADASLTSRYERAFGGPVRFRAVRALAKLSARRHGFEPAWNADLCRVVRDRVDVPVFCVGGLRERAEMDALLGDACDAVGVGRPFYAEPRLPARLLTGDARAVCESCNNCVVPQAAGLPGTCRTPSVVRERMRLEREGAYDTAPADSEPEPTD
ncbi:NADH:flavin oxidoreductase [Salinirubellus salinus]|uniref:NADH:flavin oxidoreductase n=1 Tax=Salinirubellus salinus TaxID=1364945 RepID=A0A9E7R2Q9_9EURY|nr:NADH:flavin oxidoreductase [Salinirubellus salinus]UWM54644.1 NADH:flavin oxidoreductase [Salinirubellus salinus]UWM54716.1 NADH:flavin oxidoreductase [Salinirubellus salinus]